MYVPVAISVVALWDSLGGVATILRRDYPESLPRIRNVDVDDTASPARTSRRKSTDDATVSGKEHERGSKTPGLHPDEKSDGANT